MRNYTKLSELKAMIDGIPSVILPEEESNKIDLAYTRSSGQRLEVVAENKDCLLFDWEVLTCLKSNWLAVGGSGQSSK